MGRDAPTDGVTGLLRVLINERGMSWADVARIAGLSVTVLRQLKPGEMVSPEGTKALVALVAFLSSLEQECGVTDPASWLETWQDMAGGYRMRPLELYAADRIGELQELARGQLTWEALLDRLEPNWRVSTFRRFRVVMGPDGHPALVQRR